MAQALYRKYRSQSLQEVVGQEHITDTLARAIQSNRLNHAYLFTGPRGVGKTSVARILAYEINKIPYSNTAQHLDVIEIDAASNRRIDDIRDLREKVHIAPTSAAYKVYIIDEVHMLTGESFNALLKTLEEPPQHVVFILATTEVHKLPATIVSRTQRYHFRPVAADRVIAHLQTIADREEISVDQAALELIAAHGEGSFRDSISLLDQLANMSGKKITAQFVHESLGLASSEDVSLLVGYLLDGKGEQLHKKLVALEEQGVSAVTLTQQLIRILKERAITKPLLYRLVNDLLDIPKHSQPHMKLLVTLLLFINRDSDLKPRVTVAATVAAPTVVSAAPAKKTVAPRPTQKKVETAKLSSTKEEVVLTQVKEGTRDFCTKDWMKILGEIRKNNPPLFSVIKRAAMHFEGDTLTLTFSFKLHQTKLEDSRYRSKLIECFNELGFKCPIIATAFDKAAVTPEYTFNDAPDTPADETTSSVLAMMGGGEVVNAS